MCGIAGSFAYHYAAPPLTGEGARTMAAAQTPRGPDGEGAWLQPGGRVAFAHRRLRIIGLDEASAQPMARGESHIVFNGEIYNYRELRSDLKQRGHRFVSESDTEVVLAAYEEWGEQCLQRLRGMFALAIWDGTDETLFLARDPLGIKPLYLRDDGWTIHFASQVNALAQLAPDELSVDPAAEVGFYLLGSVPEPFTIWREIHSLEAGHFQRVGKRGPEAPQAFYRLTDELLAQPAASPSEIVADSVRAHLVSDVEVGCFLSAGVDSAAVAAAAARHATLRGVTVGFSEFRGEARDEVPGAAKIAARHGFPHETYWVDREEFEADLSQLIVAMDQPSIDGLNTWFAAKAAAAAGLKVVLSGVGGDEVFCGYPSFERIPRAVRSLGLPGVRPLGHLLRPALAGAAKLAGAHPKWAGLLAYGGHWAGAYLLQRGLFMPWEVACLLGERFEEGWERLDYAAQVRALELPRLARDAQRVAALELRFYLRNQLLRDTDWAGMAHSVEIRVPLVDQEVVRLAGLHGKAEALGPLLGEDEALNRPKTGFETPLASWRSAGRHWAREWARDVWSQQVGRA